MGNIFSRRNIIGTVIIMLLIMVCTVLTSVGLFGECVTNYSNHMPIYDGAELIKNESSLLNYLGLGTLQTVWFVEDTAADVQQWYAATLANQRRAAREAQRSGEKEPSVWDGDWRVENTETGTEVHMQAMCF